jgi:two-component system NtrC family sensor kinase
MTSMWKAALARIKGVRLPIATRLTLSFLSIILLSSIIFTVVGVQIINNRIITEAQEHVRIDLNTAREIYRVELELVKDAAEFTTARLFIADIVRGDIRQDYLDELVRFRNSEGLDILTITDAQGRVVLRTNDPAARGDDQSQDEIVSMVLRTKELAAGTTIVPAAELARESRLLAEMAHLDFVQTPMARIRPETEQTSGMVLKAAAPVLDAQGNLIGVVCAGILLNRNYSIVDKIKQTVFQGVVYEGKDIGTATIFQDDVRISTNVFNDSGERAIGTRIAEDVYDRVVIQELPWTGRAYVVTDWYITAYEPIRDIKNKIVGILYVGILEQKYTDIRPDPLTFIRITVRQALNFDHHCSPQHFRAVGAGLASKQWASRPGRGWIGQAAGNSRNWPTGSTRWPRR